MVKILQQANIVKRKIPDKMKYLKWLLALLTVGIFIISLSEIIFYLKNPSSYMIGSEAMVGNGGLKYKSAGIFILYNAIQIVISIAVILLLFKSKETITILIATLLVLLQVVVFAIL